MFYALMLCIGFFGGFFFGFGVSGQYDKQAKESMSALPPSGGGLAREQQLLRQLASAQSNCSPSGANGAGGAPNRAPASSPHPAPIDYNHASDSSDEANWNEQAETYVPEDDFDPGLTEEAL